MVAGAGPGDVGVVIVDPQGRRDTVEVMLEDKGDNIYRCTYRPVLEGPHTICVTYAGAQIPKSPFTVNVAEGEASHGDPHHGPMAPISARGGPMAPLRLPLAPRLSHSTHLLPRCLHVSRVSPWVPFAPKEPMAPFSTHVSP